MKRVFILLSFVFALSSCAVTKTTFNGNITTYTDSGSVLKKWDNVLIEEYGETQHTTPFKSFGLNFYDEKNDKFIVISNAVPYIIEYTTETKTYNVYDNNKSKYNKDSLIEEYLILDDELQNLIQKRKTIDKKDINYKVIKDNINNIKYRQSKIADTLYYYFKIEIGNYFTNR